MNGSTRNACASKRLSVPKSPGALVRAVLGDEAFRPLGRLYRSVFVDLDQVVDAIGPFTEGTHLLDVGGGDGDVINLLLAREPHLRVTMIDIADTVGGWIEPRFESRVTRRPRTSIATIRDEGARIDAVLLSDVLHHVPPAAREAFADELASVVGPRTTLFVKDLETHGLRAHLARATDRYITGDRHVELVSRADVRRLLDARLTNHAVEETRLYRDDPPNYLLAYRPRPAR